ncbi:MAG: CPBP family intramembrane metalloprotease [Spirochaetaceae bacterium]|nr:CPBP family intramembrane metalloprotease [Spirochaetaceae bacterium]
MRKIMIILLYLGYYLLVYNPLYALLPQEEFTYDNAVVIGSIIFTSINFLVCLLFVFKLKVKFGKISFKVILLSLLLFVCLLAIGILFALIMQADITYNVSSNVFLLLIFCLLIGYSEELFFRAIPYHLPLANTWVKMTPALILFALAHSGDGLFTVVNAFVLGVLFTFFYLRFKNVHIVALAHSLYNFSIFSSALLI